VRQNHSIIRVDIRDPARARNVRRRLVPVAHLIGQWLSERLGQPFNIENRLGAGTNIATEAVVRATADGHTLIGSENSIHWVRDR